MSFVDIHITEENLTAGLERLAHKTSSPSLVAFMTASVEPWQERRIQERFQGEHGPTGKPWAPLAWMTEEERQSEGYGRSHPILQRSGELLDWLSQGGDIEMLPIGAQITFPKSGANQELQDKFTVNQGGGQIPAAAAAGATDHKVPARPMLGFTGEDLAATMAMLETWIWQPI